MNETEWPPTNRKTVGMRARPTAQIDNLRHVGQIVSGKTDSVGPEILDHAPIVAVGFHLQINDLHFVPGLSGRACHQLQAQRLQSQEDLGVHQRAGMDGEYSHSDTSLFAT
ncbi:hypothetical protein GCM10023158_14320 [Gluconacetobacter tumulicola]